MSDIRIAPNSEFEMWKVLPVETLCKRIPFDEVALLDWLWGRSIGFVQMNEREAGITAFELEQLREGLNATLDELLCEMDGSR